MYKVVYWSLNKQRVKLFQTMTEAVLFTVYEAPFHSVHSVDLVKE